MKPPQFSIVIPVFNSENALIELTKRIQIVFKAEIGEDFEIIFVDDGSSNYGTWRTLCHLAEKYSFVQALKLTRNFGQQSATICGMENARGAFVITMDDDLQHLPEDIPRLLEYRQHDVVLAKFLEKDHSLRKRTYSYIKAGFDRLILGKPREIQFSPFRLINRVTVDAMRHLFHVPYPFMPAMILCVTRDIVMAPVNHGKRFEGDTGYTFSKMIGLFSNLIINNSSILLSIIGILGIAMSLISFLLGSYFLYRKFAFSIDVIGWTSIFVAILFIGGILLFSVGIMGEYLIRIVRGIDRRPNYFIRDHLNKN